VVGPVLGEVLVGVTEADLVAEDAAEDAGEQAAADEEDEGREDEKPERFFHVEDVDRDHAEEDREAEREAGVGEGVDHEALALELSPVHIEDVLGDGGEGRTVKDALAAMVAALKILRQGVVAEGAEGAEIGRGAVLHLSEELVQAIGEDLTGSVGYPGASLGHAGASTGRPSTSCLSWRKYSSLTLRG